MYILLNDGALLIKMIVWNWIYPSIHFIFHQDHDVQKEDQWKASRPEQNPALSLISIVTLAKESSTHGLRFSYL